MLKSSTSNEKCRTSVPTKNSIRADILRSAKFTSGRETLESMEWREMNGSVGKALESLLIGRSALRVAHTHHLTKWAKKEEAGKSANSANMTFALDGRLVGDIGELIAAELFDLKLLGTKSKAVDAVTGGSRGWKVQIKSTFKEDSLCIKHGGDHFIGLQLAEDARFRVIYNGPAAPVMAYLKAPKANGHRGRANAGNRLEPISLAAWAVLNLSVGDDERVPLREP